MSEQNIWALDTREKHKQDRRAQATAFYLKPSPTDFILDIGCAEGFITSHLLKADFIVGLDFQKKSLLIAKQKMRPNNVDFVCAGATALPIRTAAFDKIAVLEILEHVPEEAQKRLCQEIDRVLKENGTLTVSIPYKERITYTQCIHCGELTPLWGHLHSMDEERVKNLLGSHYLLTANCHLPNIELVSASIMFRLLPPKLWLIANNLFGNLRKGYWVILQYRRVDATHGKQRNDQGKSDLQHST